MSMSDDGIERHALLVHFDKHAQAPPIRLVALN